MVELTEEEGEPKHAHTMQHERLDMSTLLSTYDLLEGAVVLLLICITLFFLAIYCS